MDQIRPYGLRRQHRRFPFCAGLFATVVVGLGLRLTRLDHGLPDLLEEATPLRSALAMWGWPGRADSLNPHMFVYPSFTLYLHYSAQKLAFLIGHVAGQYGSAADYLLDFVTDPTPAVRISRGLCIAADGVSIIYAGFLGRRFGAQAGITAAALVALAPTLIVTSSSIFTDTVMTALGLAALDRIITYGERGDRRSLIEGAALIGLAAGAKYPAVGLLAPLAWAVWRRGGSGDWRRLVVAGGVASLAFLLTTPFAALDFRTFWADTTGDVERLRAGYLGATAPGASFYLHRLARDIGWLGIVAALLSLALLRRSGSAGLLWLAFLSFALPIAIARAEFDRYLVPLVP